MKHLFILSLCFLFINSSCKKLNIEKNLCIDIGTGFQNDFLTIKLDNKILFSDIANTNSVIGVAKQLEVKQPIGKYNLTININGIDKVEKFKHKKNRIINVSFDRKYSDIIITYPSEKYAID